MDFIDVFAKSVFIEHLTEKQQQELFSILKEKCLIKEGVKKYIKKHILYLGFRESLLKGLGIE